MTDGLRICATLTAHNRRDKTLAALDAFFRQKGSFRLRAVLMDDGSTDGTAVAVRERFPDVTVLEGDGSLFWNGGMAAAFDEAVRGGDDYFLWLNDDTILDDAALQHLTADALKVATGEGCIVVGSVRDPETGALSYGGVRQASAWHPGKFQLQPPGGSPMPCDAMNGNIVLIAAKVAARLGGIDRRFTHSMGDYDYALRARKAGIPLVVAAGMHGSCPRNPPGSAWHDKPGFRERLRAVKSPKGLPPAEWAHFLKKHGGPTWPLAWLLTYRRVVTG